MYELSLFAYPADFTDSLEDRVAELAGWGVTRLAVAVAYHSAETISPRAMCHVVTPIEANVAHLRLEPDYFSRLEIPEGRLARDAPELFPQLSQACAAYHISLSGWVVVLHNSATVAQFPELAMVNAFGDRMQHGLCPSNPVVADYATDLPTAVAATGHFDEIRTESLSFLPQRHGHPHEICGVRLDPPYRLLASLCFCKACLRLAAERGIDGDRLRVWTRTELNRAWNNPVVNQLHIQQSGSEVTSWVLQVPELFPYLKMRDGVISTIAGRLQSRLHELDCRSLVNLGVWARPSSLAWIEGLDIRHLADVSDGLTVEAYETDSDAVMSDIDHVLSLVPPSHLEVVQTLWPTHHHNHTTFRRKIEALIELGISRIGLYNYSTATTPYLAWIPRVAGMLRSSTN